MAVPKYFEMHKPFLEAIRDKNQHTLKEIKAYIADYFHLAATDFSEMLPSGRQTVFFNRVGWASTYLKKAGLVISPARATFKITSEGLNALEDNPSVIDNDYLMKYESFRDFQSMSDSNGSDTVSHASETPDDTFEESFKKINDSLADSILSEIMKLSPSAFEQMVVDLMSKMGYGAFENAGHATPLTNDEGIDGIIMEDKLGFSLIYIQAKQWDLSSTVGRPDVQSFVGAISGKGGKGLFVTTAKFSKQAIDYASHQHIILIHGEKLAKLMIEHNFCVTVKKTFEIKNIDTDAFNEYSE